MEPTEHPQILSELNGDLNNAVRNTLPVTGPKNSTFSHPEIARSEDHQGSCDVQQEVMYPSDDSSTSRRHFQAHCSNTAGERDDGNLQRGVPDEQESIRLPGGQLDHGFSHIAITPSSPEKDDLSTTESLNSRSNESVKRESNDRAKKRQPQETTRLSDIIGHEDAKLRIAELTLPLALPEYILNSVFTGIRRLPTTILLHGPPGCGKVRTKCASDIVRFRKSSSPHSIQTKLARAIAGEAAAALVQVSPSDVLSKFVGESEALIRNIFYNAVEQGLELDSRCAVIFIDEIDALGQNRDNSGVGEGEACSRRILTELLIKFNVVLDRKLCTLQDFGGSSEESPADDRKVRIVVAAATNRPDDCDSALLRRFELMLEVGLPTPQDRLLMFEKHLHDIDHNMTPRELNLLAAMTADWSGSGIETLCRDAVQAPVRECIRHAILLSKRAADSPSEASREDHSKTAYNALLAGITALRPVTLIDFHNSIRHVSGQVMPALEEEIDEQAVSPKRPRPDTEISEGFTG
jgi:SpoVK/Ycf46/Vps4 family AAA+-type ATPase